MMKSHLNKEKRKQIRSMILDEYKQKTNPNDTSLKIQKMFGYNFETRLSTIRMWFEQFYLGDESLENDPFREDLVPMKQKIRKRKEANSTSSNSKETQTKLLFKLKEQVDLLYQEINAQNCCLQLVDRFLKKYSNKKRIMSSDSSDNYQKSYATFCQNYRFLRKKCQLPTLKINFYDIIYKHIYSAVDVVEEKNNSGTKRRNQRRNQSKKSSNPTNSRAQTVPKRKHRPRSNKSAVGEKKQRSNKSAMVKKKKKKKLRQKQVSTDSDEDPLSATCAECQKVYKNRARMKIHVKQIHGRTGRRYCKFEGCEVSYARQSDLTMHIRIVHTKDAPEFRCTWAGCSYLTYNKEVFRHHMNFHTGERPYKCTWPGCDKAFKSHSTLTFHKKIHKNERRYKCQWPGCGYACNISSNLNKHKVIHERKKIKLNAFPPENSSTTTTTNLI